MTHIKQLLVLFVLCLLTVTATAQMNRDMWFKGTVELEGGERLSGKLSYYSDFKAALLQIQTGGKTLSYDANQVVSFRFYDEELGITRTFYSLPYSPGDSRHQVMLFFEALLEGGHLSALSKTEFRTETRHNNMPYTYRGYYIPTWYDRTSMRNYTIVVPYETLYLVTPNSSIEPYSMPTSMASKEVRFRKPDPELFMRLVKDRRAQVEAYIEKNKLDIRRRSDLLHAINYYNQIKDQSQ
ncbi:hypothetical protein [Cesiribacter sp. SM1]|uniref:hypothetical protein n=1 Tax=Cesiribacter sp. SM1 TaxID=2861196 RepID=UPI001CD33D2F|nr:hypothetical protein [Cesiribacter sp. SM1]